MPEEKNNKNLVPVIDGVFTLPPEEVRLIGVKCPECGVVSFPKSIYQHKPGCKSITADEILLQKKGFLRSYTIQYYQPPPTFKCPEPFEPYALGSVELGDGIEIAGIITGCKLEQIKIGMPLETTLYKLYEDNDKDIVTYAFCPI